MHSKDEIMQKSFLGGDGGGNNRQFPPAAGTAFEELIVSAASGRHGGLRWHVSAPLLIRASQTPEENSYQCFIEALRAVGLGHVTIISTIFTSCYCVVCKTTY